MLLPFEMCNRRKHIKSQIYSYFVSIVVYKNYIFFDCITLFIHFICVTFSHSSVLNATFLFSTPLPEKALDGFVLFAARTYMQHAHFIDEIRLKTNCTSKIVWHCIPFTECVGCCRKLACMSYTHAHTHTNSIKIELARWLQSFSPAAMTLHFANSHARNQI